MIVIPKNRILWLIAILSVTIAVILTTIFSLKNNIFDIFPYFYILPIILLAIYYPRIAVYFTILLGWIYLGLVYFYGPFDVKLFASSVAFFYIFVTLGVIISSFVDKLNQEKKFGIIFANSQAGIFTFDRNLERIGEINIKAALMLGYEPDELRNKPLSIVWTDQESRESFLATLTLEHLITDSEIEFQKKDGSVIWALVTATQTTDYYIICSAVDITERKRIMDVLDESEVKYRTLFNSANDSIFIHDMEGNIFEANRVACERVGYSQQEVISMNLRDFDVQDYSRMFPEWIKKLQSRGSLIFDSVHRRKYGEEVPIEVSSKIISYRGAPAIISIIRDISERRKAERSLRESEKKYRMIGELIPFGVWMSDERGNFTYLSGSFLDLLGITLEQSTNNGWIRSLPTEDRDRTRADWNQCVQTGCFWDYEYRIIDREGQEHFILSRGAPMHDDAGNVVSWVGIHIDITERRREHNRLETSLREKEVIIKEVHHRVKNNMQVISGFLLLQSNYIDDPASIEKLNECQRRVRTMALVHEKLYQSDSLEFINTNDYIRSLIADLKDSYLLDTSVDISVNIEQVNINLDTAIPIGLIINELVTNALKHAFGDRPGGKVTVDLHLGTDHWFTLIVQDDGAGLPPDFDSRTMESLGMQLVHILTRQLGGEINVSGNNGARFEIRFPEKF
jgi:PAS domain S-box-containing protein